MIAPTLILVFLLSTAVINIEAFKIALPPGRQVEGVTHARGSLFFAGDVRTGSITLVDTKTRLVSTTVRPQGNRSSVGLHAEGNLLFAAGGGSLFGVPPALHVYNIPTGTTAASCRVSNSVLINDVVADKNYAYYTDSFRPVVYRLRLRSVSACNVTRIRLPQRAFIADSAFRANGIELYAGGLLVVNVEAATIYFIDLKNGNRARAVLPEGSVKNPDGLQIVRGKKSTKLYVTQNLVGYISVWKLSINKKRVVSMKRLKIIRSKSFELPTTVAVSGRTLVVANSRFDMVSPVLPLPPGAQFSVGVVKI